MTCDNSFSSIDSTYNMIRVLSKQKQGLQIIHLNAQSLNNKFDEFKHIFVSSGVDLICISETWFHESTSDSIYKLSGYNLVRADRKTHGGGVCIFVRNGINYSLITKSDADSQIEFIFLQLKSPENNRILVGCVYRPNRTVNIDTLMKTLEISTIEFQDVIIAGDFNSNIFKENVLLDAMQTVDLYPVNINMPTHYSNTANTLLDLFFVNNRSKVLLYDQLSGAMFSRHDIIILTYDFKNKTATETIRYRDYKSTNYNLLQNLICDTNWNSVYEYESIDEQISFLESNINRLFDLCVPLRHKIVKHNHQPWFNDTIKTLINKRDVAYHRWKKFKTPELHSTYKYYRQNVVKHIADAKTSYYKNKFSSALNSKSKWREIRNIGIGKDHSTDSHLEIDLNKLNDSFVGDNNINHGDNVYKQYCNVPIENMFTFRCVGADEVWNNLLTIKSNATGMDQINPRFLKMLLPTLIPHITYIFNNIITKSTFPLSWKTTKKNLLSTWQSGFRPKRSCTTALIQVTEEIRKDIDKNLITYLVLLDHSKAFDMVNHSILLTKLEKFFFFSSSACRLIASYLNNRSQTVCLNNNFSKTRAVTRGVPQGSTLGPLLFCIYINDLPDVLKHCKIHMYADDVQLFHSDTVEKNFSTIVDSINEDLECINTWALNNGLSINPNKSKCIIISKRVCPIPAQEVKLNGNTIKYVPSSTNLGIIFNEKLNWSNHINSVAGKVYGMLRNLWIVQSATPFEIRMLLAKTYLIPTLLYGAEVFSNCSYADFTKLKTTYNNIARYRIPNTKKQSSSFFAKKLSPKSPSPLIHSSSYHTLEEICLSSRKPPFPFTHFPLTLEESYLSKHNNDDNSNSNSNDMKQE
ncbi:uncharacterized protein LOC142230751 [Haematobia irritans]|uniref:uncharacterized protein LOC142230751 n=1 Tax=Haematobia irritans TaxID=7368 RepID=UPI003F4F8336